MGLCLVLQNGLSKNVDINLLLLKSTFFSKLTGDRISELFVFVQQHYFS